MEPRLIVTVGLVIALVATAATPLGATRATAEASSSCEQTAIHDVFRTEKAIEQFNSSGAVASTAKNTDVEIEDAPGFIRLRASNPNGYCVSYHVEVSPEIVAPADLGEIEADNGTATANWRAAQNLSSGDVYTQVTFTLGPGEDVLFAPSTARVKSLSWTGQAKEKGSGIVDSVTSLFGDQKLEKKQYEIEPTENSSRITVPLTKNGEQIEDWQASYTLDGEERPVTQDAEEPVYYTESSDSVTFHFSQTAVRNGATVDFTAEPSALDEFSYSADSYWSGISEGAGWLPFATVPTEVIA